MKIEILRANIVDFRIFHDFYVLTAIIKNQQKMILWTKNWIKFCSVINLFIEMHLNLDKMKFQTIQHGTKPRIKLFAKVCGM